MYFDVKWEDSRERQSLRPTASTIFLLQPAKRSPSHFGKMKHRCCAGGCLFLMKCLWNVFELLLLIVGWLRFPAEQHGMSFSRRGTGYVPCCTVRGSNYPHQLPASTLRAPAVALAEGCEVWCRSTTECVWVTVWVTRAKNIPHS